MKRREMLVRSSAAALGMSALSLGWAASPKEKKQKVLYFTRSVGFEHSVVRRKGDELSHSEKILTELGAKHDVEVECTKDGRVFDKDLEQYDAIAFYTCGDLTKPSVDKAPPMSLAGKKRLLDAVAAGKAFVGIHSGCDSFRKPDPLVDPYIAMVGGQFVSHGAQQEATMRVASANFPGAEDLGKSFKMKDEWYAMKHFAKDLHVILVQETAGMKGPMYQRPSFPSTWARKHGKGRVFYTSLGHREDVWTSKVFQQILTGGFGWAMGHLDAPIPANIDQVTPKANQLTN